MKPQVTVRPRSLDGLRTGGKDGATSREISAVTVVSTYEESASTVEAGRRFPNDFLWGSATSSYQIEGASTTDGRG
jgi:hypothetical protein